MPTHQQKILKIVNQLKNHKSGKPVSFKKKAVAHQVPKPGDKRVFDEKIDISDLNEIIEIDTKNKICTAEPGVTFVDLVEATFKLGYVPIIVPELKTITIGGAVAGCSIESMSFKYGGFHDTCLEYEVITAKGEVLICTPKNKNKLLFQMVHGTFGTLGIISKLKFKIIKAKPYVKVIYEKYGNIKDYKQAIYGHFKDKDVDFMDGIIHSPKDLVLSVANFSDVAPYTNKYDWMKIYYLSTRTRSEDFLKTPDYFFRYDKGVTNVNPKSFLGRLFFGKLTDSSAVLKLVNTFKRWIPDKVIPITIDLMIPFTKVEEYLKWHIKELGHFPLWCVPYKIVRKYEWLSDDFLRSNKDELFIDLAIYGMKKNENKNYYKIMEDELIKLGAIKTLISNNFYSESDFWKFWNKKNYDKVKKITDPNNIFRDLYSKTCKAVMGL
jgi:hypothetical protein